VDVYLERQLPLLVANLIDRFEACLMRCVVDQDVDPAQLRDGLAGVIAKFIMPGDNEPTGFILTAIL
jgi:hypothetical protein